MLFIWGIIESSEAFCIAIDVLEYLLERTSMGNKFGSIREIAVDCRYAGERNIYDIIRDQTRDKQMLYDKINDPKYYMSIKEKIDYDSIIYSSDKTPAQKFAAYVYDQAKKFLDEGYCAASLAEELQQKRIHYFLTRLEKEDADAAFDSSDRTLAQKFAVYVYEQAENFLGKGYSADLLAKELQRKRIRCFLTRQEREDVDVAMHSSDRTPVQKFAVYVYDQAKKLLDKGYSADAIAKELRRERIRYFLTPREKEDADAAMQRSDGTLAQKFAVYVYEQAKKLLDEGCSADAIAEKLQRKRICYFLTKKEKKDADAAMHSSDGTPAQKFAAYVYDQAKKLLDKGSRADAIAEKLQRKRICYFLTKQEKKDYDVAPSIHEKRDPTDEQVKAVRLYRQVRKILEEGSHSDWHEINQQIQSARESIYGRLDLVRRYFDNPYYATPVHGKSSVYNAGLIKGCVVNAAMMLLHDQNIDNVSPGELARALNYSPSIGTWEVNMPDALNKFGSVPYEYTSKDTIDDLREALKSGFSCGSVILRQDNNEPPHIVVVDKIGKDSRGNGPFVYIRDDRANRTYKIIADEWEKVWQKSRNVTKKP
jgi:hypothetical protein